MFFRLTFKRIINFQFQIISQTYFVEVAENLKKSELDLILK